jgi:hypothetical protein
MDILSREQEQSGIFLTGVSDIRNGQDHTTGLPGKIFPDYFR